MVSALLPTLPPTMRFIERDWLSANHIVFFDTDSSGGGMTTVVDTGYKKHALLTLQLLQHASLPGFELKRVINTHLHSDHCGGNALLQSTYANLQTLIPAGCAKAVTDWNTEELTYAATGQECDQFGFTQTYQHADQFELGGFQWVALAAPGHDNTMLLLYCAQLKMLISADALWENGFGITFPELDGQSGFREQGQTLDVIESLAIDWVIPGHGPMFSDVTGALKRARSKLAYLQADPQKHQYLAIKVLIKFLLLDKEKIEFDQLPSLIKDARLFTAGVAKLEQPLDQLLMRAVDDLVTAKAATWGANDSSPTIYNA
jgi:glyoxylase-like metal-dependent hydrolase (beta-lactamase superfamily II)